jgi:hypothetical protein
MIFFAAGAEKKRVVEASLGVERRADNARDNMPSFIRYLVGERRISIDYKSRVETYLKYKDEYVNVRYRNLIADTASASAGVIGELVGEEPEMDRVQEVVAACSFEAVPGRRPGQEVSTAFVRKRVSGDWRNHFCFEAASVFDAYAGDLLIRLGYEPDNHWVAPCASNHEDPRVSLSWERESLQ